jgi:hypothetical protein
MAYAVENGHEIWNFKISGKTVDLVPLKQVQNSGNTEDELRKWWH